MTIFRFEMFKPVLKDLPPRWKELLRATARQRKLLRSQASK